jgi:hypothetical protein
MDFASDIVVAIDFGVTHTSVAYAIASASFKNDPRLARENIHVIYDWPNAYTQYTSRTPSILVYGEGDEPVKWGGNATRYHPNQVAYFKLGLEERASAFYWQRNQVLMSLPLPSGFLSDSNWKHPAFPNKRPIDFTADYLTAVNRYVMKQVSYNHFRVYNRRILYVLTVPAIWGEEAKELTRQAAFRAGIPTSNLTFMTELEATAMYCATSTKVDLTPGGVEERECFLICDAGGVTVVSPLYHDTDGWT